MVSLQYSAEVLLIGKAILIAILGVFLGFVGKYVIRKAIDSWILKKIIKDDHIYDTTSLINKIFTETLQWIVIIGFFNYSLTMLGFNFLTDALQYIIANIPKIAGFVFIILAGLVIARLVAAYIRKQEIEHKNEIVTLIELIIFSAFLLTALEFVSIKATALIELYKVILYIIGVLIILLIINPRMFEKGKKDKKEKKSPTTKLFFM